MFHTIAFSLACQVTKRGNSDKITNYFKFKKKELLYSFECEGSTEWNITRHKFRNFWMAIVLMSLSFFEISQSFLAERRP